MWRLKTFGAVMLTDSAGGKSGPELQRQRLALLAFLAVSGDGGASRDTLMALLWPDADAESARHSLRQALYGVRQRLGGEDVVTGTTDLRLNGGFVESDAALFERAIRAGDLETAVALYAGPFLEGFHLRASPEFERWSDAVAKRLALAYADALQTLATGASSRGEVVSAVKWCRLLAVHSPFDSRTAACLVESLAASGDRAGAITHVRAHAAVLKSEFGLELPPSLATLMQALLANAQQGPGVVYAAGAPDVFPTADMSPVSPLAPAHIGNSAVTSTIVTVESARRGAQKPAHRRRALTLATALAAAIVLVLALRTRAPVQWPWHASGPIATTGPVVIIAPFRMDTKDSAFVFLRTGLVDLLSPSFAGLAGTTRAIDPATVLRAWARDGRDDMESDAATALRIARALQATRLVRGSVVAGGGQIQLMATITDVRTGAALGSVRTSGSADSIPAVIDRFAGQLLSLQAGERDANAATLATTPLTALRSYLDGRAAFRRSEYANASRLLKTAIAIDSTFALAAGELGRVSGWMADDAGARRGWEIAWANQHRLGPADRVVMRATLGPRYPQGSSRLEHLGAWERVAELLPDQPDGWYEAGDMLFHNPWLGTRNDREGLARARALFERALDIAPEYRPALQHLIQLAAYQRDTSALRRLAARAAVVGFPSDVHAYFDWRIAIGLPATAGNVVGPVRLADSSMSTLQWLAMTSQEDGLALTQARQALQLRTRAALTEQDRIDGLLATHALALNEGDLATARRATSQLEQLPAGAATARHIRVFDVLYGGMPGDSTLTRAVAELTVRVRASARDAATGEQQSLDLCVLGHAALAGGALGEAERRSRELRAVRARFPSEGWATGADVCALLLDASVAVRTRSDGAKPLLGALDSALGAGAFTTARLLWDASVLASAQALEASGDVPRASQAIRRRNWFYRWPHYLAAQLYQRGRLAQATGDSGAARRAFTHYLALRDRPDSAFSTEVASARTALQLLKAQ